jgi:hypothetical protein
MLSSLTLRPEGSDGTFCEQSGLKASVYGHGLLKKISIFILTLLILFDTMPSHDG